MSLSRAQNIFMPANINSIVILAEAFESQDGLGVLDQENCLLIG